MEWAYLLKRGFILLQVFGYLFDHDINRETNWQSGGRSDKIACQIFSNPDPDFLKAPLFLVRH